MKKKKLQILLEHNTHFLNFTHFNTHILPFLLFFAVFGCVSEHTFVFSGKTQKTWVPGKGFFPPFKSPNSHIFVKNSRFLLKKGLFCLKLHFFCIVIAEKVTNLSQNIN